MNHQKEPPPSKIYKFYRINDNLISTLKHSYIWLSSPDDFNDPFDCYKNLLTYSPDKNSIEEMFSKSNQSRRQRRGDSKKYLKRRNSKQFEAIIEENIKKFGVACFCEEHRNILMWSHYADCHKGLCLCFNTRIAAGKAYFSQWIKTIISSLSSNLILQRAWSIGQSEIQKAPPYALLSYTKKTSNTMTTRSIKHIEEALPFNMGGMIVYQPLPSASLEQVDPVLLIHHARVKFPGHKDPLQAGVGPHPHRGFSPVTFIFKGGVHHRDSLGNSSVIYEGGTQWIHSGQGILHSERPPKDMAEKGGIQEIMQIWINVPAKHKMDAPTYQPLTLEETPAVATGDEKTKIWVVAGNYEDTKGPVQTLSPMLVMRMRFEKGSRYSIKIPASFNALIYLLEGKLHFGDEAMVTRHMAVFNTDGNTIAVEAAEDSTFVLLSGEPINEPVAARGPFVMNTQAEISAAIRDYEAGKFGELVERE